MPVAMPTPNIVYNQLITTQIIKTKVMEDIQFDIEEKEYAFEGKKRTYLRMSARKAKAQADVSSADAQLGAYDTAIAALPDGDVKDDLIWQRTQTVRKKENAVRVLQTVDESAIVQTWLELEAEISHINALGVVQMNILNIVVP